MRKKSLAASLALAAGLALLSVSAGVPASLARGSVAGAHASSPEVNVWVTTADGRMKLSQQAPVAFGAGAPSSETLVVDPTR